MTDLPAWVAGAGGALGDGGAAGAGGVVGVVGHDCGVDGWVGNCGWGVVRGWLWDQRMESADSSLR